MFKHPPIVNIDMDGVVADFDAFVMKSLGRTFDHAAGPGADKEMWDFLMSVPNMYAKLEPTPYAEELVEMVSSTGLRYRFLTAIPRRATMPTAEDDKREWIARHFPGVPVVIGPFSRDKWKHAFPGDILIDDRADNIDDWNTKGQGHGILHLYKDFENTRTLFNRIIKA